MQRSMWSSKRIFRQPRWSVCSISAPMFLRKTYWRWNYSSVSKLSKVTLGSAPVCDWQSKDEEQCLSCPALQQLTWFGDSTNNVKVKYILFYLKKWLHCFYIILSHFQVAGISGQLVDSRVSADFATSDDWSVYTVYLMLPGDWSDARIFTWVFDVADVTLEADGSSTLVTLSMNANSPTLTSAWSDFYVGFDNIKNFIDQGVADSYKIGLSTIKILNKFNSDDLCFWRLYII